MFFKNRRLKKIAKYFEVSPEQLLIGAVNMAEFIYKEKESIGISCEKFAEGAKLIGKTGGSIIYLKRKKKLLKCSEI